jgi:(2Fe-2S) ferredoxin
LLVRRLHRAPSTPRRWAVVDARPGKEAAWWGSFDVDEELLAVDPHDPAGHASGDPILLVCTHGRRDACCAQRGWPVVAALTESFPDWSWQCSHVGGDRFAANLVVLPHGLYYGRLTPSHALDVVRGHLDGRVTTDVLRGRSCFPPAVQAAQHYARETLDVDAIDALSPLGLERQGDGGVAVRLAGEDDAVITVVVEARESRPISRLTCAATGATSMLVWELQAITTARG